MYLAHFGLKEPPFSITPDTDFFFSTRAAQEALNTLLIAVHSGEGFIKISGEVGTGKTLLCRKLMLSLGPQVQVAYIPNPYLEPMALFLELAIELGLELTPTETQSQHQLLRALTTRLIGIVSDQRRVVVCLDEAQAMPIETLEALRLLTNIETEKRKLLQVIIFGQPELNDKLDHPSIRQLKQRITFDYHLGGMSAQEVDSYVAHRLRVAGCAGDRLFTPLALWQLRRSSRCVPRLVNILAHKALLSAYGKGNPHVGLLDVLAAARDTASLSRSRWTPQRLLLAALTLGTAGAIGWSLRP